MIVICVYSALWLINVIARRLPIINVAVTILQRGDGHVLLAERPHGNDSAGYWEFPGSKFEMGEQAEQASRANRPAWS